MSAWLALLLVVIVLLTLRGFTSAFIKGLLGKSGTKTEAQRGKPWVSIVVWFLIFFPVALYLLWKRAAYEGTEAALQRAQ